MTNTSAGCLLFGGQPRALGPDDQLRPPGQGAGECAPPARSRARRGPRRSAAARAPPARPAPAPGSAPGRARPPADGRGRAIRADPTRPGSSSSPPALTAATPDLLGGARLQAGRRQHHQPAERRGRQVHLLLGRLAEAVHRSGGRRARARRHQHRHPDLARAVGNHRSEARGPPPGTVTWAPGSVRNAGLAGARSGSEQQLLCRPTRPGARGRRQLGHQQGHLREAARKAARSGPGSCPRPRPPAARPCPHWPAAVAAPSRGGAPVIRSRTSTAVTAPMTGLGSDASSSSRGSCLSGSAASGAGSAIAAASRPSWTSWPPRQPGRHRRGQGFHRSSFSLSSTGAAGCRRITDSTVLRRPAMSSACTETGWVADRHAAPAPTSARRRSPARPGR